MRRMISMPRMLGRQKRTNYAGESVRSNVMQWFLKWYWILNTQSSLLLLLIHGRNNGGWTNRQNQTHDSESAVMVCMMLDVYSGRGINKWVDEYKPVLTRDIPKVSSTRETRKEICRINTSRLRLRLLRRTNRQQCWSQRRGFPRQLRQLLCSKC